MNNLKPGDRALVVITGYRLRAGDVVSVTSTPHWVGDYNGKWERGNVLVVSIESPYRGRAPVRHLVRIPPDSEARQMFRETEKTKEAA